MQALNGKAPNWNRVFGSETGQEEASEGKICCGEGEIGETFNENISYVFDEISDTPYHNMLDPVVWFLRHQ